jgi:hypothetical protein
MTTSTPEIAGECVGFRAGEEAVTDRAERWFRACPDDLDSWDDKNDAPTNLMFKWGSGDAGELSGTRSDKTTAEKTFDHLVEVEGRAIKQIRSVTVEKLSAESLHLHDDSANLPGPPDSPPGHTFLDVRHLPTGKRKPEKTARERVRAYLLENSTKDHPVAASNEVAAEAAPVES